MPLPSAVDGSRCRCEGEAIAGGLQVDTDLLARAGATLTTIRTDLDGTGADAAGRHALGHDGLADTVDAFTHGWDDARTGIARTVGELGDACRQVATTFDGIDADLAARLREAFS